jgi:hypothetical protein
MGSKRLQTETSQVREQTIRVYGFCSGQYLIQLAALLKLHWAPKTGHAIKGLKNSKY